MIEKDNNKCYHIHRIEGDLVELIVNFFEYTLSGWVYIIWFVLMIIFSLACLGVVGDKVSKKRLAELKVLREKAAEDEYKKAQETIEKQTQNAGVGTVLDPTAPVVSEVSEPTVPEVKEPVVEEEKKKEENVIVLDEPKTEQTETPVDNTAPIVDNVTPSTDSAVPVVDNSSPVVDNTNADSIKTDVPAVLVINEDGTSNT